MIFNRSGLYSFDERSMSHITCDIEKENKLSSAEQTELIPIPVIDRQITIQKAKVK